MQTIRVDLPDRGYDVRIEAGALETLGAFVSSLAPHARACLVVDARIADAHGARAEASLRDAGYDPIVHPIEADEREKRLATVERLYAVMLAARLERRSPVVAVGGGIVGDVAGFAAATYLRGVPLVQVPTTLLAMVDASVGGKTGVNFPLPGGDLGKNLVGAFWQPVGVLADPRVLATLDRRDLRCGLAECIKHAVIADATLLDRIEAAADAIEALDEAVLEEIIARCVQIKATIVAADEREAGIRALLNLGHTFGHAVEPIKEQDLRHGEAVAVGMCAAARCAAATGRLAEADAERIERVIARVGLPTALRQAAPVERLVTAMGFDKKVSGDRLRLVLPTSIGAAETVDDVDRSVIERAWQAVGAAAE
jgi:3-dehydroquinate synthase